MNIQNHNYSERNVAAILFKGALPLSIADAASKGASAVIALLIARFFGPAQYGQYATAASVCGLFMMITGIGFEQEFTRRAGLRRETTTHSLMLNFIAITITSVIAYILLSIFFAFNIYSKKIIVYGMLLGLTLIATRFHLPFRHLCMIIDKSHITAAIQSFATIFIFLITICIILFYRNLLLIINSQLMVSLVAFALWIWWFPKKDVIKGIRLKDIKQFFIDSIPFAISNIIWIAYFNFDTFMLSIARTESEVGVYAGVYRIIGINYIVGYAVTNSFTPALYDRFSKDTGRFSDICSQLLRSLIFIGIPLCGVLFIFSGSLIPLIIGEGYSTGITISRILSLAVLFRLLNFGLCEILTTSKNQKARVALEGLMLLVNIIFNFFFIVRWGGAGAAAATVLAEIFLFAGSSFACFLILKKMKKE